MSNCPTEETISCLAVNRERILHNADISGPFLIELIIVTDSWKMLVPTAQGHIPLEHVNEGQMTTVHILDGKLERFPAGELEPVLQTSCVLQAIRKNPQIGRTWIVQ